jgi:hypothetical protein
MAVNFVSVSLLLSSILLCVPLISASPVDKVEVLENQILHLQDEVKKLTNSVVDLEKMVNS